MLEIEQPAVWLEYTAREVVDPSHISTLICVLARMPFCIYWGPLAAQGRDRSVEEVTWLVSLMKLTAQDRFPFCSIQRLVPRILNSVTFWYL